MHWGVQGIMVATQGCGVAAEPGRALPLLILLSLWRIPVLQLDLAVMESTRNAW